MQYYTSPLCNYYICIQSLISLFLNLVKLKIIVVSPAFLSLTPKFLIFQWRCYISKAYASPLHRRDADQPVQWTLRAQNRLLCNQEHPTAPVALHIGANSKSVLTLSHKEAQCSCSQNLWISLCRFSHFPSNYLSAMMGSRVMWDSLMDLSSVFLIGEWPSVSSSLLMDCFCHGIFYFCIFVIHSQYLNTDSQRFTLLLCCL